MAERSKLSKKVVAKLATLALKASGVGVVADVAGPILEEISLGLTKKADDFLTLQQVSQEIEAAFRSADECFRHKHPDILQQIASLPMAGLRAPQKLAARLQDTLDHEALRQAIRAQLTQDWRGHLTDQEISRAADCYYDCLLDALASVGKQLLQTIYARVKRIERTTTESVPTLRRIEELLEAIVSTLPIVSRPALSPLPSNVRSVPDIDLVGREVELRWLRETEGDRLLVGHPGSGKTFLLSVLTRQGWGLFVESEDPDRIAYDLRNSVPKVVILDDAHFKEDLLRKLLHLRQGTGAKFDIVAVSWPGRQDVVASRLGIPSAQIHALPLLTRDEIVDVIRSVGVYGPDRLIREIVDQAEGRPGLAVTLAQLCLNGGVRDLALGDALRCAVRCDLEPLVGPEAFDILAAFGLGGGGGMQLDVVAQALGISILEARRAIVGLAAGGVISEVAGTPGGEPCLVVRPRALREALVRDAFFAGPAVLPIRTLIENAVNLAEIARTLVGVRARKGSVELDLITGLLEQAGSVEGWEDFAWLGPTESEWILAKHPDLVVRLAGPLLVHAPKKAIPILLSAAVGDVRPLHSYPQHPLRRIKDWVEDTEPDDPEAVNRRKIVLRAAEAWIENGEDEAVGTHVLALCLVPKVEMRSVDPGVGRTVTLRSGPLSDDRLQEVHALWPRVLEALRAIRKPRWQPLLECISDWAYSRRLSRHPLPAELREATRRMTGEMMSDLAQLAQHHQGVLRRLKAIAGDLGLEASMALRPDFEILFPIESVEVRDPLAAQHLQAEAVRKLARRWMRRDPGGVARDLVCFEEQAADVGLTWPRYSTLLAAELAKYAPSPGKWGSAFLDVSAPGDLIGPFLEQAALQDEQGWQELASDCLKHPGLAHVGVSLALTQPGAGTNLFESAFELLSGFTRLIEIHCVRNEISEQTIAKLLAHEDPGVACTAAIGEWLADPKGSVRASLLEPWRSAITRYGGMVSDVEVPGEFWLRQILSSHPPLALEWLRARLRLEPAPWLIDIDAPDAAAISALDTQHRIDLLNAIPVESATAPFVREIVGSDVTVYQALLQIGMLSPVQFAPLSGRPLGPWVDNARAALKAGFSPDDIARAAYRHVGVVTWAGSESGFWDQWRLDFAALCADGDPELVHVAEVGMGIACQNRDRARAYERQSDIFGL